MYVAVTVMVVQHFSKRYNSAYLMQNINLICTIFFETMQQCTLEPTIVTSKRSNHQRLFYSYQVKGTHQLFNGCVKPCGEGLVSGIMNKIQFQASGQLQRSSKRGCCHQVHWSYCSGVQFSQRSKFPIRQLGRDTIFELIDRALEIS